jgi:hypothetical protein
MKSVLSAVLRMADKTEMKSVLSAVLRMADKTD